MNFLAHAYLSFSHPETLVGNMMTDFICGKERYQYPKEIQNGIELHHRIDSFTDTHPATLRAKEYLRPATGRYCGVFMDVVYDHFLACDPDIFPVSALENFSVQTYKILDQNKQRLPEKFKRIYPYMKKQNWLLGYSTQQGIIHSFHNIYQRAQYLEKSDSGYQAFKQNYTRLEEAYQNFMPDMIAEAKIFLAQKDIL